MSFPHFTVHFRLKERGIYRPFSPAYDSEHKQVSNQRYIRVPDTVATSGLHIQFEIFKHGLDSPPQCRVHLTQTHARQLRPSWRMCTSHECDESCGWISTNLSAAMYS